MSDWNSFIQDFNKVCKHDRYVVLKLFVDDVQNNLDLYTKYVENAKLHNNKLMSNENFMDAGFDLMLPYNNDKSAVIGLTKCVSNRVNKIDLRVKCSAQMVLLENKPECCCKGCGCDKSRVSKQFNTGYYLEPRSSISKSCMRMANSHGIIDSGYRGNLITMVDCVYEEQFLFSPYERYFQICAPGMVPVVVCVVDSVEDLGEKTSRGEGGFGSTGLTNLL